MDECTCASAKERQESRKRTRPVGASVHVSGEWMNVHMRMHAQNVGMHEAALQSRPRACVCVCVCVCAFVRACVYKHAHTPEQEEGDEVEGASKHVMVFWVFVTRLAGGYSCACVYFCVE